MQLLLNEDAVVALGPVDRVVGQESGPVVDAVVGKKTAYGHARVWVRLGEGQAGGQTGAEVGAADVDVFAFGVFWLEVLGDPGVAKENIVDRGGPVEGSYADIFFLFFG